MSYPRGWNEEIALLVQCVARARGLAPASDFAGRSPAAIDECLFLALADRHKCTERVGRGLAGSGIVLSGQAMDRIRKACLAKRAAREILLREWGRLVAEIESMGVPLLTLKGPAIAIQLYGDPHAREYRDLDLLVDLDDQDLCFITERLRKLGYETSFPAGKGIHHWHHLSARIPDLPVFIEIHGRRSVRKGGLFPISAAELFSNPEVVQWKGQVFLTPSPATHGLFMLAHGSSHLWMALGWIADAAKLLTLPLDWERFWESCRAHDMERVALSSFHTVGRFFQVPRIAPPGYFGRRDSMVSRQASRFALAAFRAPGSTMPRLRGLARVVFYSARLRRSFPFKLSLILRMFRPVETDADTAGLSDSLGFLLWFLRPIFVIARAIRGMQWLRG